MKRLCILVALVAALLFPAAVAYAGPSAGSTSSAAASSSGSSGDDEVAWGASVMSYGAENYGQALDRSERRLDPQVIRYFLPPGRKLAWPEVAEDYPLVISFKLSPRAVLSGSHDAELRAFFAATKRPSYWSYFHEPEDNIARGQFSAADYRAAWKRIDALADASRKPLRSTLILMGFTAKPGSGRAWTDYYAGDDVIDVLAWDCYAWTPGDTPADAYGPALRASQQAGKPWAIAETGVSSTHRDADRLAKLRAMSRYLATAPAPPEFVTYFDSDPTDQRRYGWNISRDRAAAAAWRAGQDG